MSISNQRISNTNLLLQHTTLSNKYQRLTYNIRIFKCITTVICRICTNIVNIAYHSPTVDIIFALNCFMFSLPLISFMILISQLCHRFLCFVKITQCEPNLLFACSKSHTSQYTLHIVFYTQIY